MTMAYQQQRAIPCSGCGKEVRTHAGTARCNDCRLADRLRACLLCGEVFNPVYIRKGRGGRGKAAVNPKYKTCPECRSMYKHDQKSWIPLLKGTA